MSQSQTLFLEFSPIVFEFSPNLRRNWKSEERKGSKKAEGRAEGDGERVDEIAGVMILKVSLKFSTTTEWNDFWHKTVNMQG